MSSSTHLWEIHNTPHCRNQQNSCTNSEAQSLTHSVSQLTSRSNNMQKSLICVKTFSIDIRCDATWCAAIRCHLTVTDTETETEAMALNHSISFKQVLIKVLNWKNLYTNIETLTAALE